MTLATTLCRASVGIEAPLVTVDLSIALGILAASGQIPTEALENREFLGELTLSGAIQPVVGTLPAVAAASKAGHPLFLPRKNLAEASLVSKAVLYPLEHLLQVTTHLSGEAPLEPSHDPVHSEPDYTCIPDLAEVRGQQQAKRALTVAAAGQHKACCSWTSCPSFHGMCWKCCANPWRSGRSAFREQQERPSFQRPFSWWPP